MPSVRPRLNKTASLSPNKLVKHFELGNEEVTAEDSKKHSIPFKLLFGVLFIIGSTVGVVIITGEAKSGQSSTTYSPGKFSLNTRLKE